jgi:hypothetical protein
MDLTQFGTVESVHPSVLLQPFLFAPPIYMIGHILGANKYRDSFIEKDN